MSSRLEATQKRDQWAFAVDDVMITATDMSLTKVAAVSDLKPGQVIEVTVGERPFALCNSGGAIHCFDGTCPHAGGPLGEGALQGDMLVCPWHGWEFNAKTGVNDSDEDLVIDQFPVVIHEGTIFVDIPE